VAEGVRVADELLRSSLTIQGALIAPQLRDAPRGESLVQALHTRGVSVEEVSPQEFLSAAETESPQGVIVIGEIPDRSFRDLPQPWNGVVLALDGLQDPGNVGTIVRTAAALGAVATITLPGTVDLWNAKVVRSGMGAQFRHPSFAATWNELDEFRSAAGVSVLAADAGGEPIASVSPSARALLVVGNEGAGLSPEARDRADRTIALPLAAGVESLNVAVAAGILLHQLRP